VVKLGVGREQVAVESFYKMQELSHEQHDLQKLYSQGRIR